MKQRTYFSIGDIENVNGIKRISLKRRGLLSYLRTCKYCKEQFNSIRKHGRVCLKCKKERGWKYKRLCPRCDTYFDSPTKQRHICDNCQKPAFGRIKKN